MFLILFEIGLIGTSAAYLVCWRISVHRRRALAWKTLVANLKPKRCDDEIGDHLNWNRDLFATPEERWQGINGAQGLWAMFKNAGLMLDIANYVAANYTATDPELIAAVRHDAFEIRVRVTVALSKYAYSQVNESTCTTVSRATAYYADMMRRTAELVQANGGAPVPEVSAWI